MEPPLKLSSRASFEPDLDCCRVLADDWTDSVSEVRRCASWGRFHADSIAFALSCRARRPAKMSVHYLGIFSIVFFYLLILGVGMWAARKSKGGSSDSEEVMLAGRNIGLLVGVFTMTGARSLSLPCVLCSTLSIQILWMNEWMNESINRFS